MSSSRTRVPAASGPTTFEHPTPGWTYPGTAPGPAEARHDAASPPAAPVTQPAALELGPDGVPYIRKPDGSRNGLVETTTGPGGGVYFPGVPLQTNTVPAGFRPSILASLVTGATYSQVGTTVTVTAVDHGLPTNRNGYRIFFPGAAAVHVGWYENFAYVDANTFTFKNPTEQTIAAGTAITGTLPYTTTTTVAAQVMPGGSMGSSGVLMAKIIAGGDATAGTKTTRLAINSAITSSANHTTTSMSSFTLTVANVDYAKQVGVGAQDGANTSTETQITTQDTSVDFTASITGKLTNAAQWRAYDSVIFSAVELP